MNAVSKLYEKCEKCKYKDSCNDKRMVACGLLELSKPNMESETMPNAESFSSHIEILDCPSDKFISVYQRRVYEGDIDSNPRINYSDMMFNVRTLGEYFSEGYREYIENRQNLKTKDSNLFYFIKGLFKDG